MIISTYVARVVAGTFVVGFAHRGSLVDPEHCNFVVSTGGKYVGGCVVTFTGGAGVFTGAGVLTDPVVGGFCVGRVGVPNETLNKGRTF